MTDPFAPARLGPVILRNRVLKAATFEGMSPGGVVSPDLIDFHRQMAAGGTAMTTVSYVAVSRDGRGAPNEIYIHDRAADGFERIASAVHAEGAAISAQLGHAGAVGTIRKRYLGPSASRTIAGTRVQAIRQRRRDAGGGRLRRGGTTFRASLPRIGLPQPAVEQAPRRLRRRGTGPGQVRSAHLARCPRERW
jgi:2,4-dienoyl-CoA reductase-like NADH-dependent reductase (Old Yellow Enzyme family)